jgi:3',5'-cyclic-AMP phosphodiesterase
MKIAIISDIHLGPTGYYKGIRRKLTELSEDYVRAFVRRVSSDAQYAFAVHLGDLIQDQDVVLDGENIRRTIALFGECEKPVYHLIGNHDVAHLSLSDVLLRLGYQRPYYSFVRQGFRFIVLYSEVPDQPSQKSYISSEQITWLREELSKADLPTVVFCHHSLAEQDLTGNPWFEGRPEACLIENRKEVRELLVRTTNVLCVVNGHLHWNRVDLHSHIPFITIQSATENFRDDGTPANVWAELELSETRTALIVHGNDSMRFEQSSFKKAG